MTTGHNLEDKVFRNRRRPKKTSTNKAITWPVFDGDFRKVLPIPTFIDMYNQYIGGVDIANQLRAIATTHFNRYQKEYFPGIFFSLDISTVNSFKLYESLNGPFLYTSGKPSSTTHRDFLESLVDLIFLYDSREYANIVPGTSFKSYPKYSYTKASKPVPKSSTTQPRRSFIVPTFSMEPIEEYTYIKASTRLFCTTCKEVQLPTDLQPDKAKKEVYGSVFNSRSGVLEEIPLSTGGPKRIRGRQTY